MQRFAWCLSCALVVLALAAPTGARADGVLTLVGSQLRFDSDSTHAENLVISRQTTAFECGPTTPPCIQFANGGGGEIRDGVAGSACSQYSAQFDFIVTCSVTAGTSIFLKLDDGNDFVSVLASVPPTTMDGSFDNDELNSANGADTILGGPGDDQISDSDSSGDDTINGGDDDDIIDISGGDDDVSGGAGIDTVIMGSGDDTVRLDDVANDGPTGETKNIRSDVEVIDGDGGSDNLFGNAGANTLVGGSGNDLIQGAGGADVLEGDAGADELNGGTGVDRVIYSDSGAQTITLDDVRNDGAAGELDNVHSDIEDVAAGPGNDAVVGSDAANVLDGGPGNDRLDGRGGVDTFLGADGADVLLARDGARERVDCGPGNDSGQADTIDLLVACEAVALSDVLVPDVDGDGATKPSDCDDHNPAIHPGAFDVPENGIDEDCSGADAAVPPPPTKRLNVPVTVSWALQGNKLALVVMIARRVPKGTKARVTCKGKKCPFKRKSSTKRRKGKITLFKRLSPVKALASKKRNVRGGQLVELRLTKPGFIGQVVRYKIKAGRLPVGKTLCLPVGAKKPRNRC